MGFEHNYVQYRNDVRETSCSFYYVVYVLFLYLLLLACFVIALQWGVDEPISL